MEVTSPPGSLPEPPQVLKFTDYRQFMLAAYEFKRSRRSGFTYRRFSQMAGLKSPNFLNMVIKRKRNLSLDLAGPVAKALGLNGVEAQYFIGLVAKDRAKNTADNEQAQRKLQAARRAIVTKKIPAAQMKVLTHWWFLVIREMLTLPDFEPRGEWISRRLRGLVSCEQAEEALKTLVESGFVCVKDGAWRACEPTIDTGDTAPGDQLLQGHIEMMRVWAQLLPALTSEERELGYLNIPIASSKLPEFKERIRRFQDEIIGWLQEESEPDLIVQLATYLIPMTSVGPVK